RLAGGHRRRRTAAETDEHRRAAEHDHLRARLHAVLLDVLRADVAHAAGDHDRLVVAADLAVGIALLEAAEVAVDVRPAELVVERRRADRSLDHDVQRRDDALGLAVVLFPGLLEAGDAQVGDGEAAQARLRPGAAAGRALVADLAAGTGGRAGERRDRRRVVVR